MSRPQLLRGRPARTRYAVPVDRNGHTLTMGGVRATTMGTERREDRCPGVLRPHLAADGALVRLRLPGGRTTATSLLRLSRIARAYGNPDLQLTSRGGLQVRGLPPDLPDGFVTEITSAGFLPAPDHERVRNITASPLTGVSGGRADVSGMVTELDQRLTADPELARLPGRFLFVLDDGRGDVRGLAFDLAYVAIDGDHGLILVGTSEWAVPTTAERAIEMMIGLARDFLTVREAAPDRPWHVRDVPEWCAARPGVTDVDLGPSNPTTALGVVGDAASVQVPLSLLTPAQTEAVASAAESDVVVITPWRGMVLPGAADGLSTLTDAGLVADHDSAWSRLTACVGAPGCASALIDTRSLAGGLVARGSTLPRVHVSGCDRRCGAPAGDHLDLVAPITLDEARHRIGDCP